MKKLVNRVHLQTKKIDNHDNDTNVDNRLNSRENFGKEQGLNLGNECTAWFLF